jgi:hypothetical protein
MGKTRGVPGGAFLVTAALATAGCMVVPPRPVARSAPVAPAQRAAAAQQRAAPAPIAQRPFRQIGPVRGDMALRIAMLAAHNVTRVGVGIAPLAWDQRLAAQAAAYAAQMARSNAFGHAAQVGYEQVGENLWMGTRGAFRFEDMANNWRDERRLFKRAAIPYASRTGRFEDVGHYTQMIWRGTTHLGCGLASNGRDEFLVCRYWPAGNVFGRDPFSG